MTKSAEQTFANLPHILIVDDDDRIRQLVSRFLQENGFVASTVPDAKTAREALKRFHFDCLVVDIMMPGEDGLQLTAALRGKSDIPILLLTALGETEDRLAGFESGADDYLPKPFEPRELVARLKALLRRQPGLTTELPGFRMGRWLYDAEKNELSDGQHAVRLTDTEGTLLRALASYKGKTISREKLSDLCRVDPETRAIDVQINRLRRKLEDDPRKPRFLFTARGKGYRLAIEEI